MTTEPPQGLKANLKRVFTNVIDKEVYNAADFSRNETRGVQENQDLQAKMQSSFSRSSSNSGTASKNATRQSVGRPLALRP